MQIINPQFTAGIWTADIVEAGADAPTLQITHLGVSLDDVTCTHDATHDVWRLRVALPHAVLSDGVQTCVISDASGTTIGSFSIICGDVVADDLRAQVDLLRAELELLQQAFRRHCAKG